MVLPRNLGTQVLVAVSCLLSFTMASTAKLPAYPLAVRSPYISAWLAGNASHDVTTAEPFFWAGQSLQWSILARVDGKAWNLFGAPNGVKQASNAKQVDISYTSTHTYVNLTTDSVDFTLDFFSPVSPKNYTRQSLPFSYLTVTATPHSGSPSVQILNAIDDSWTAQAGKAKPSVSTKNGMTMFTYYNPNEIKYSENNQMASYGSVIFGAHNVAGKSANGTATTTWGTGSHDAVNQAFISNGALKGNGSISQYSSGDLTALAQDLGKVSGSGAATFAVGLFRSHVVNYLNNTMSYYSAAQYPDSVSSLKAFFADHSDALKESQSLDSLVASKGRTVSGNYSDMLEGTVRQIFGATEVVIYNATMDTKNPMVFLKEISSDGNVNTVDVIYPTSPVFSLIAPEYLRLLLQPYLTYFQSSRGNGDNGWTQPYIAHDMGKHYPVATGYNGSEWKIMEYMPLEVTGSFFAMALQYVQASGDSAWIKPYLTLLRPYADYLAKNGRNPAPELSTVDSLCKCANQTQLAVVSAVGLAAYGKLSGMANYTATARSMAAYILQPGVGVTSSAANGKSSGKSSSAGSPASSLPHMTYVYGKDDTWGAMFPLFTDMQLGLGLFNQSVRDMQSAWYATQQHPLGLPYAVDGENQIAWTVTDWTMFAAGAADKAFQNFAVNSGHAVLTGGYNSVPFPTKYNVEGSSKLGNYINNKARSTIGSYFTLLWQDKPWSW